MSILALVAAGYLAVLLIALITGAVGTREGSVVRTRSPEGYWVMVGTYGLAGFLALVTAMMDS